ncbi:MAG TPA: gas vesicle protein GvpG [Jatrophihabitantaceae bacterium]|jgi:hypothetical protein
MGLLTGLLTLPLAPVRGVVAIAQVIEREAYRQWTDPATVREQLAAVDAAYQRGELTEQERDEQQDQLVARLLLPRDDG